MSITFSDMKPTCQSVQQTPIANQATKPNEELTVEKAMAAKNVGDTYETSVAQAQKPKGLKGIIVGFKNFFVGVGEYTKGTLGGIAKGIAAGSIVYTGGSIINHFKAKAGEGAKKVPNKALAVLVGGVSLAINLWKASLNVNEKRSENYHRWVGH